MDNTKQPKIDISALPTVLRKINFSKDDFLESSKSPLDFLVLPNDEEIYSSSINNLANAKFIGVKGSKYSLIRIYNEYPIVEYSSQHTQSLNRNIAKVIYSSVDCDCASYENNQFKLVDFKETTLARFVDNEGISHEIDNPDLFNLLRKKPSLQVTPEGILIFYSGNELFATIDCLYGLKTTVSSKSCPNAFISRIFINQNGCTKIALEDNHAEAYIFNVEITLNNFELPGFNIKITN